MLHAINSLFYFVYSLFIVFGVIVLFVYVVYGRMKLNQPSGVPSVVRMFFALTGISHSRILFYFFRFCQFSQALQRLRRNRLW